ncbi:MAG: tRNA (guanosine(46)-N7)-methyltransferase TrmB, partial [Gammaproteobacteria bacterium]
MNPAVNKTMRRIRSFVLREGRLTQGQQNAINNHWVKYGLNFTRSKLDL